MPKTATDAPKTLPAGAKKIWASAFNGAYDGTCKSEGDRRAECAARIAMSAVKKKYKQTDDGKWISKSLTDVDRLDQLTELDNLKQLDFIITRASSSDGELRWLARASDTLRDDYETRMTHELFESFIANAKTLGMPYLSIAHYDSLDGKGIAGEAQSLWIDGIMFKGKGVFNKNLVGRALYSAICEERSRKDLPADEKIRLSIGFWDLKHAHGDTVFTRTNFSDECPICLSGTLPSRYLEGILVHFAATRVPVNRRTAIDIEGATSMEARSSAIRTRRADAASIVGDELADLLEEETDKKKDEISEAAQRALVVKSKEDGTGENEEPFKEAEQTQRAFLLPDGNVDFMAFGGATSIQEAQEYVKAQELENELLDQLDVFWGVARNIMRRPVEDISDRKNALGQLMEEFSGLDLAEKPQVEEGKIEMSEVKKSEAEVLETEAAEQKDEQEEQETSEGQELQETSVSSETSLVSSPQVGEAFAPVVGAIQSFQQGALETLSKGDLTKDQKLKMIQPLLTEMAKAVQQAAEPPTTPETQAIAALRSAIHDEFAPLAESLQAIAAMLGTEGRARRTHRSLPVGQNLSPENPEKKKPNSVDAIARRSVGIVE